MDKLETKIDLFFDWLNEPNPKENTHQVIAALGLFTIVMIGVGLVSTLFIA